MSLLLEALKKAEKAKEEAQRQASGTAPGGGLEMEPVESARHVTTRAELPDIGQPMEISSDDIRSATPPPREAAPQRERRSQQDAEERPRAARATAAQPQAQPAERAAAKKVFEAKFKEPNPKLPFYIAMGVLGAFALGTVIYFWMELSPPPPLVNPNPPKSGTEPVVAIPEAKPAAPSPQATPPAAEIPGLPDVRPAPPSTPAAAVAPAPAPAAPTPAPAAEAPVAAKPAARARAATAPRQTSTEQATPPRQERVAVRRAAPAIDPQVSGAYEAYNAGNLGAARSGYERALATDPSSRDALLGLAAVEMRSQNYSAADALYQKLLRADPRDPHAQAGMLALRSQSVDPVAGESRVKSLLANDPESGVLHFTLANQYAQQGRWAEAQQSYFKAHASEPDNPDFAYNLAVSLDRLRQRKLAADYYLRALDLAARRSAAFDPAAARTRLLELTR